MIYKCSAVSQKQNITRCTNQQEPKHLNGEIKTETNGIKGFDSD